MITLIVYSILSGAVALVAGMLLSKVYFTTRIMKNALTREAHEELLHKQARQNKDAMSALQNKARLKLSSLTNKIDEKDREIVRLLSDACSKESVADSSLRKLIDIQKTEITSLSENLTSRDARIEELNLELRKSQTETQQLFNKFNTLQERVEPLTRRLQMQQENICQLEEKLARAVLGDRAPQAKPAPSSVPVNGGGKNGSAHAELGDEPTLVQPRDEWRTEVSPAVETQVADNFGHAANGDEPTLEQPREAWHAKPEQAVETQAAATQAPNTRAAMTGDEPTLEQPRDAWHAETQQAAASPAEATTQVAMTGDEPTLEQPRHEWHSEPGQPVEEARDTSVTSEEPTLEQPRHELRAETEIKTDRDGPIFDQTMSQELPADDDTSNEVDANRDAMAERASTEDLEDDAADDLKKIRGIGPALERRLNKTGIRRYRQIAAMSRDELADIAEKISVSPAVATRYDWIEQARALQ